MNEFIVIYELKFHINLNLKRMIKRITICLLLLIIFGCNVQKALTEKWNGKTKKELILAEGAPSWIDDDTMGGEILVYQERKNRTVSRGANGRTWMENVLHLDKTMYYVNNEGKIYNVIFKTEPIE